MAVQYLFPSVCVLLLCACASPGEWPAEPAGAQIRIMTYNIHHGEDLEGELSLDRIAGLIAAHEVDVVALQEVDSYWAERSAFADQPGELAEKLGMEVFYAPIYDLEPAASQEGRRRYGLAVLSRFPIIEQTNHELTRQTYEDEVIKLPGFPAVTLDVGGARLHVYNTHLDYRPDPTIRQIEISEMLEIIEDVEGPTILLGDLNARPDAAEMDTVFAQFVDAWGVRGSGDGFTFPAGEPDRRIDYILVSENIRVDSVAVLESTASDHRPVVADLTIRVTN